MRALWGRLLRTPVSVLLHCPPGGSTPAAHPPSLRFEVAGLPAADRMFIFDGDYVDRGAWGLEIVLLLAAWALAAPRAAYLVRGNHESKYCRWACGVHGVRLAGLPHAARRQVRALAPGHPTVTPPHFIAPSACSWVYGFRAEVLAKYGSGPAGEAVFEATLKLFAALPLAAVVARTTLVVHGGLARAPPRRATRRSVPGGQPAGEAVAVALASLADIAAASKGGDDPDPAQADQRVATDILWSDPASAPGVRPGARPGDVGACLLLTMGAGPWGLALLGAAACRCRRLPCAHWPCWPAGPALP